MAFPWRDPQFWLVSGASAAALLYVVRKRLRFRRKGEIDLPCDNCPSRQHPAASGWIQRLRGKRAALLLVTALTLSAALEAETVERRVAAMGTALAVRVDGVERGAGLALSDLAIAAVAEAERNLSTWRDDSELTRFNEAAAGETVELSAATAAALDAALACHAESDGAFDPTIAPLVAAWGLRTGGREPTDSEIEAARAALAAGALRLQPGARSLRQPGGARIEEGGFGKGAGLDLALERVARVSNEAALRLDFGGQIAWSGQRSSVVVRLADPSARDREVLELTLTAASGSLSTSGNSERAVVAGGKRRGHLLDPRTGRPAADFGSATIFSGSATVADCRSTALFVLGPERGARWLAESGPGRLGRREGALLVVENGGLKAILTPGLAASARALVPEIVIEVLSNVS